MGPSESAEIEILSPPRPVSMDASWHEIAAPTHFWMEWRFRTLVKHADLLPPGSARVLEVGCGRGAFLAQLARTTQLRPEGCDLDLAALQAAQGDVARLYCYDALDQLPRFRRAYPALFVMSATRSA